MFDDLKFPMEFKCPMCKGDKSILKTLSEKEKGVRYIAERAKSSY